MSNLLSDRSVLAPNKAKGRTGIHIGDLWASPSVRGQGVGSALLRHVVSGKEGIDIDVFVVGNSEARLFYEKFAFCEQTKWRLYRVEADE